MKQCILCGDLADSFDERVRHFEKHHKREIEEMPEINHNMTCEEIQRIWQGR